MYSWVILIGWIYWAVLALGAVIFLGTCLGERKNRAALRVALVFGLLLAVFAALLLIPYPGRGMHDYAWFPEEGGKEGRRQSQISAGQDKAVACNRTEET